MPSKRRWVERNVRRFDKSIKPKAFDIYLGLMETFVRDYPDDVSSKVLGLLRAKDFEGLINWVDSYGGAMHTTAAAAYAASQLSALIKKYPFPAPDLKPKARDRAIGKFLTAENRCRRYNLKFSREYSPRKAQLENILQKMRSYIRTVLGDEPNLGKIYAECGFGPGASVGVHGRSTNLARKLMSDEWTCTPSALPYAVAAMAHDQHLFEFLLGRDRGYVCMDVIEFRKRLEGRVRLVHYNKIVTVPKTTLVDRTIAVEPLLNGYLQKGVDVYMRRLLKRVGIDLTDQGRNQDLARLGSTQTDDPYITIDLSLASDSVSKELVRELMPPDWYCFLDAIRSPAYKLPDSELTPRYQKFVSMGNGFCFPLETLIFASVCQLYSQDMDFSVYGDDIIVRQSIALKVIKTLWAIGFRHNPEKTFVEGQFRESCGADWFAGCDVRPLTLDYELDSLSSLIKFHNMTKAKPFWELAFQQVREYLIGVVPRELHLMRPYPGQVFGAFEVPLDMFQACPYSSWNRDIHAWAWIELDVKGVPDRELQHRERYDTALIMAAVRGSLSRMPFARRRETSLSVRRESRAGAISNWLPA